MVLYSTFSFMVFFVLAVFVGVILLSMFSTILAEIHHYIVEIRKQKQTETIIPTLKQLRRKFPVSKRWPHMTADYFPNLSAQWPHMSEEYKFHAFPSWLSRRP